MTTRNDKPEGRPENRGRIDSDLMRRVSRNEESAIIDLYDRFGSLVFRMAYQALPTRAEAEDAVQEIFVRLWRTAEKYDHERSALVTWVMLISRRYLVDKLRRNKARIKPTSIDQPQVPMIQADSTDAPGIEQEEKLASLMQRISGLPVLQQTVIKGAYLRGQTLRQISDETGKPLGTIKSALSRALVKLRERTGEELAV